MRSLKGFLFLFAMVVIFSHHAFSQSKIIVWESVESLSKEKKEILIYPASSDNNNGAALGIETKVGLRPNWIAAIYPVVSMQDELAHFKSRKNLIGEDNLTKETIDKFSLELNIPDDMPPIYVQASKDDDVVDYRNSVVLDKALTDKNINHKFMLFETGGHGYGMKDCEFTAESKWQDLLLEWLCSIDVIRKP